MKKIIIFFMSLLFIFASDIENIKEIFKEKNYEKVYEILDKEYLKYLDNLEIQFIYAKSAFYTKHYKDAVSALQRILIYMPKNIYARYELAKVYFAMGNYIEAKKLFEELLEENIPVQMKKNILKYLKKIKKQIYSLKKYYLSGLIEIGGGYEYNINLASNKDDFYVPVFDSYFKNILDEKSDFFHIENLFLNFIYDIGNPEEFYLQNRIDIYNKMYLNEKDYNILSFEYSPIFSYIRSNYIINNGFGFGYLFYGNEKYGYYLYYQPEIVYKPFNFLKTKFNLKFQKNNLKDNQNYYFFQIYGDLNIKIGIFYLYPKTYIKFDRKTKKESIDIDKNVFFVNNDFILNFSKTKYILSLYYKYSTFLEKDPLFKEKRKDRFYEINLKKESLLFWGIKLVTSLEISKNYSNFDPYSYKEFQIQFSLKKDFR